MTKIAALTVAAGLGLGVASPITAYADMTDTKVPMDQVPEAVRATARMHATGGDIKEVDRLSDDGKLYKAEIKKKDSTDYLYIESSGKLVGQHVSK